MNDLEASLKAKKNLSTKILPSVEHTLQES